MRSSDETEIFERKTSSFPTALGDRPAYQSKHFEPIRKSKARSGLCHFNLDRRLLRRLARFSYGTRRRRNFLPRKIAALTLAPIRLRIAEIFIKPAHFPSNFCQEVELKFFEKLSDISKRAKQRAKKIRRPFGRREVHSAQKFCSSG